MKAWKDQMHPLPYSGASMRLTHVQLTVVTAPVQCKAKPAPECEIKSMKAKV